MMRHTTVTGVFCVMNFFVFYVNGWNYNLKENIIPCSETIIYKNSEKFIWRYSEHASSLYAASENPICWNNLTNNLAIRKCDITTGQWSPATVDCSILKQKNTFCPEDLIEIPVVLNKEYICIKISEYPHEYDDHFCYGSNALAHRDYLAKDEMTALNNFLLEQKIHSFWMPVQRPLNNEYNPFVVRLPGNHWSEVFKIPLAINDFLSDKHCLAAIVSNDVTLRHEMTNCHNILHSVCVFKNNFLAYSGCPQGFGAMSYRPNECYGIEWEAGLFPCELQPMTIMEYFEKRNSLRLIFKQNEMDFNKYFSVGGFTDDSGSYEIEMNANQRIRIVPLSKGQPNLSSEILVNRKNVELALKLNSEREDLILTVYNRNYIWRLDEKDNYGIKCFTNADYEKWKTVKIKKIWQNDLQTKTMFELKLIGDEPGYYWCEAHTIFDFALVGSQKIVATKRRRGHSFAILADIRCEFADCLDVNSNVKYLSKKLRKQLNDRKSQRDYRNKFDDLRVHNLRIISIESVAVDQSFIRCLCHVMVSLKSSSVDNSFEQSSEEIDSEENDLGIRHDTSIRMRQRDLLKDLVSLIYPHLVENVRSTEFCFPESFQMENDVQNQWLLAQHGQAATTLNLCLQRSGLPITRKCEGDFLHGANWETLQEPKISCISDTQQNIITKNLFDLNLSKISKTAPEKAVKDIISLLENNISDLIPADVYYVARIMQSTIKSLFPLSANSAAISPLNPQTGNITEATSNIVRIYNYLMKVNENIIKPTIVLNSTNILLEAFENLIDKISMMIPIDMYNNTTMTDTLTTRSQMKKSSYIIDDSDKLVDTIEYKDIGVIVKIASNFVIFIIQPSVSNVTGIALFKLNDKSDEEFEELGSLRGAFEDEFYRFILANQSVDDLLYETDLQLATYVPTTLLQRLDEISELSNHTTAARPEARIVIKVYSTDKLFQEDRNFTERDVWGKVVSVSIPGHDKDLPEMLPLILRVNMDAEGNSSEQSCNYWNYKTWVNDGLTFLARSGIDNDIILCGCTHLTPFAYLIAGSFNLSVDSEVIFITKMHEEALDIITLLGCSLSLFGIVGIFVTAVTFQTWRQKASSKVLLQLSAAIALQMVLFCFVNTAENTHRLIENKICIAIGACMHYSVLVQFCWMIIIAYLQFKRYVQVFGNTRPKRFFIKSTIVGWGAPLIPVLVVLFCDQESYIPDKNSVSMSICYPSGYSLYFGVVLPISITILANLIIFVIVIYNILRGPDGSIRHTEKRLAISQVRLAVLLFFLLGFTWIFGLMIAMKAGLIFSYLFCLTATLQGFVLFIYFIILDPITRRMWRGYILRIFGLKATYDSSTSMKETTQTL